MDLLHNLRRYLKKWPTRHPSKPSDGAARPIYQAMLNFFEDDEWPLIKEEKTPVLYTTFQGDHGRWLCSAEAHEEENQIVFYSICPQMVAEERRDAIAHFITRANYGLIVGNFELDFDSGQLRYKTSLDLDGTVLTNTMTSAIVYTNILTMDQYLPGLLAVMNQSVEPKVAIKMVEIID